MLKNILQILWPTVGHLSTAELKQRKQKDDTDVAKIRSTDWEPEQAMILEEARHLATLEKERKASAETKASMYLAGVSATVTIGLPLCTSFYTDRYLKLAPWQQVLSLSLFGLSLAYLLGAAWWSFRTFKVAPYHRVDAVEYADVWVDKKRKSKLVAELFVVTRLNRHMVNWKTTCVRQAHGFLLRSLASFTALVVVVVLWEPSATLSKAAVRWIWHSERSFSRPSLAIGKEPRCFGKEPLLWRAEAASEGIPFNRIGSLPLDQLARCLQRRVGPLDALR